MMYLEENDNEYTLYSIKKVKKTLQILEKIQLIEPDQMGILFQGECCQQYNKFISRIFNQADRLLTLEQHQKQSEDIGMFFGKVEHEKYQLLEQFFKIITLILRFIGKLNQSVETQNTLIEEVLYFTTNYYTYINRSQLTHISTETDILLLYTECLRCLNNFCEGNQQNQNLVFSHKPLVSLIQFVITTTKYDILADNLQDNYYRLLFKATIQLLLQVKLEVHHFYSELNFQSLFEKLLKIYETLAPRIQVVIQGQKCTHTENINCTYLRCQYNLIAQGESEVFTICFDLIILFNILSEHVEHVGSVEKRKDYWQTLRGKVIADSQHELSNNQKQNINFLRIYISMRNFVKQSPFDGKRAEILKEYLSSNDSIISSLEIKDFKQQQKISVKKKVTPMKSPMIMNKSYSILGDQMSPKTRLKESIYKITAKKQLVKQSLDEAIPFKKFEEQDGVIETVDKRGSKMEQKIGEIAINWLEGTQQNNQRDILKKDMCVKMAEAINFFSKYVGQIQINIGGQNHLQYFILPFQSSFLLQQTTKKAKQLRMRRGRYEQLKTMSDYFQQEVIFRQRISMYPYLNWLSINIDIIKVVNYLIALTLNICYLADLARNGSSTYFQRETVHIIVIVLTVILIMSSVIVLIIEIINSQPYIAFRVNYYKEQIQEDYDLGFKNESLNYIYPNPVRHTSKNKRKKKTKMHQYFNSNRILAQITNLTFIYHICYLVLAILSFIASPLISLLLFDIVARVKGLRKVLQAVLVNFWKIFLILYITLILIHCYSFLAFLVVDDYVLRTETNFTFIKVFLQFIGNGFRQELIFMEASEYSWGNYIFITTFYLLVFIFCFALIISVITGQYSINYSSPKNQKNKSCKICGISYIQCREINTSWQEHIEKNHKLSAYLFFLICLQQKQELNYVERAIAKKLQEKDMSWLPHQ